MSELLLSFSNMEREDFIESMPEVVVPDSDVAQLSDEVRAVTTCKVAAATSTASEAKSAGKQDKAAARLFDIEKLPIAIHNEGRPALPAHQPPDNQLGYLKAKAVIGRPNYTMQITTEDADKIASVWKQRPRPVVFQSVFFREKSCEIDFQPLKLITSTEAGNSTTGSCPKAIPTLSVLRQFSFVNASTKTPPFRSDQSS